ncbi:MAG: DnaJ domain-containing protein [Bacteroidales bacterium]
MKDYYSVLEIEFGVDILNVKKAYRRLALKYHPDKNKEPYASEKFIEITEAYEVLSNDVEKRQYDNLYSKYFDLKKQGVGRQKGVKDEKTQAWSNYGRKKAEEYASMRYDDFVDRVIDEMKLSIAYIPNVIFILICCIGVVSSFYAIIEISVAFGLISLAIYGTVCYFLYDRARKDYIVERRRKILNKYK